MITKRHNDKPESVYELDPTKIGNPLDRKGQKVIMIKGIGLVICSDQLEDGENLRLMGELAAQLIEQK